MIVGIVFWTGMHADALFAQNEYGEAFEASLETTKKYASSDQSDHYETVRRRRTYLVLAEKYAMVNGPVVPWCRECKTNGGRGEQAAFCADSL